MAETMHKAGRWRDLLDVTSRIRAAGGSTPMNWPTSTLPGRCFRRPQELAARRRTVPRRPHAISTSLAGSKAAVALGERYLTSGRTAEAEKLTTELPTPAHPMRYWLARGYIVLR